jgi:hypothetical protein
MFCPSHPPRLCNLNNVWRRCKLWSSSLRIFSILLSLTSLLRPNIPLSALFPNTLDLCQLLYFTQNARLTVSHPYKTRGKIMVLHVRFRFEFLTANTSMLSWFTTPCGLSPEDGDSMLHRDAGIYLRVHSASQPRRTTWTQFLVYKSLGTRSSEVNSFRSEYQQAGLYQCQQAGLYHELNLFFISSWILSCYCRPRNI